MEGSPGCPCPLFEVSGLSALKCLRLYKGRFRLLGIAFAFALAGLVFPAPFLSFTYLAHNNSTLHACVARNGVHGHAQRILQGRPQHMMSGLKHGTKSTAQSARTTRHDVQMKG
eukprot:1137035-Pelagomonas_calceolata.AAC.3